MSTQMEGIVDDVAVSTPHEPMKQGKMLFTSTMSFIVLVVLSGILFPEKLYNVGINTMNYLTETFGWIYMAGSFAYIMVMFFFAFSKYGDIRFGSDDSKPEFSTFSWMGMLFSAGMGTVMLYWGVAEPVYHYINPLSTTGITPQTAEAAEFAMKQSFIHQGIQAWSAFSVVGLILGYLMYRKKYSCIYSPLHLASPLILPYQLNPPPRPQIPYHLTEMNPHK